MLWRPRTSARTRRSRAFGVLLALAVPSIALVPLAAAGDPPQKKAAKPQGEKEKNDPENVVAISVYMETIAKGNERFVAKDFTSAIDAYKKAIQLSPKNALGHYLLAEAYLAQGNVGEAEPSIKEALESGDAKNPSLRSRVLFLSADMLERQKKWDQAKAAWQAYAEHVAKYADAGFPQTSAERLKAIQKVLDNEKAYVAVRERIAAEKADAGKSAPPKK